MVTGVVYVPQHAVHHDFTVVAKLVESRRVLRVYRMVVPRHVAISLHFIEIEEGTPEPGDTTVVVDHLGGACGLVHVLQKIVDTEEVFPCAYRPTGHLACSEVLLKEGCGGVASQVVARRPACCQFLGPRCHVEIQPVGIQLELLFIGKKLLGIHSGDGPLVKVVVTRTAEQRGKRQTYIYLFHKI